MTRFCFIRLVAAVVAAGCLISSAVAAAQSERLNVLFIISDDLRAELGSYGSELAQTPNLDRFAASGVRFDRAYCQYPLCNPSRSSMLTGRHPKTTGVYGNRTWFGAEHSDFISLPKYFKQHGYPTLRAGKIFHGGIDDAEAWTEGGEPQRFGNPNAPAGADGDGTPTRGGRGAATANATNPGQTTPANTAQSRAAHSDRWVVIEGRGENHGDSRVADRTIEYLQRFKDQTFFIACGFSKPHSPLEAPQWCYDLYPLDKITLPPDFAPRPTVPEGFPRSAIRPRNADLFIGRDATPEQAREMIRGYLASVSFMDWNVGRVLAELDRLGLREKTIVVFWGDHGYQLGEKGKWSKAGSLFEQGARVPLIIHDPRARGNGQTSPRVVQAIDIYPTLAELCGLPPAAGLDGRSLAALLDEPRREWNHPAFTVWSENGTTLHGVAVRTERWRYAEFADGGVMLLDPLNDPKELKNFADDPALAATRAELSALIRAYAPDLAAPTRTADVR